MTSSLNHHRASQKRFARTFILQFLIVAIAAIAMLACMPSHAYAKSYTCPSVTIDAQANADGSLDVTEARTFDFSGNFTAVWWTFDNMPTKESMLSVKSVSLTNESTGETQTLSPVEFQRAWREAGGAGCPSYSIDEDENTVYVFFDESDSEVTMTLSYSISNFVQVYDDVAEVYSIYRPWLGGRQRPCHYDVHGSGSCRHAGSRRRQCARMGPWPARRKPVHWR